MFKFTRNILQSRIQIGLKSNFPRVINQINVVQLNRSFWNKTVPVAPPAVVETPAQPAIELVDGELVDTVVTKLTSISNIGDLKLLGLASNYTPVGWIQQFLEFVHVTTGMEWWATIAVSTLLARVLLFPVLIKTQRAMIKMTNIKPQIEPIQTEMNRLRSIGDAMGAAKEQQKLMQVFRKEGVSPFSGLWGLLQAPVFISFFLALRAMCSLPVPGFSTSTFFWIQDLTLPDPYMILPIASAAGMLAAMELNRSVAQNQSPVTKNIFRFLIVGTIPFFYNLASGVFIYTAVGAIATLIQTLLLQNSFVRRKAGLPEIQATNVEKKNTFLKVAPLGLAEARKLVEEIK
ncbi:Mitochondrial inner membrane protein oxa1l [Boothiomyces sp. JEL0866]|nr:Mitochondrial inner membrane protein oxa1l [Boothiomyces sp. JEL0866]